MAGKVGPEYQRLMDQIRSKITSGEYPVGGMIPSTAELKEMTGMSIPVVRRAVGQLEADGILEGHPGKGVYVKAMPADVDGERRDIKALSKQITELQNEIRDLSERTRSTPAADKRLEELASEVAALRKGLSLLQAQVMNLYQSTGQQYPYEDGIFEPGRQVG